MEWSKVTALVLSIISIFFAITVYGFFIPLYLAPLAFIFAIVAIVSTNNHNKINPEEKVSNAMGIISLILSIIAFIIAVISFFLIGMSSYQDYKYEQSLNAVLDGSSSFGEAASSLTEDSCYDTLSEGESGDCGDLTITFDGYSNEGNTYIVDYTIENNGDLDFEYDKQYDATLEYNTILDFDFAKEEGIETIGSGEEKSFTSTFKANEEKEVYNIEIDLYSGSVYLEVN